MHPRYSAIRVDAQGLSKQANGTKILTDVSLSAHPGEFIGLLGPSGAGKSTLLNALNGFRPADTGRVLLNGTNLYKHYERFRALIGYVPQDDIVHKSLTAYKALFYAALLRFPLFGVPQKRENVEQRVREVLRLLGLEEHRNTRIKRLSGGQRKRVSLGIELLTSPPLLFLDEPTSGLDPGLEERMMTLFRKLAHEGRTVIITTHIMESLELLDLVAILVKGQLVFYGPPQFALRAFQVKEFSAIYVKLEQFEPTQLAKQFRVSPLYKKYVTTRLAKRYKTELIHGEPGETAKSIQEASPQLPPHQQEKEQAKAGSKPDDLSLDEELARLKDRLKKDLN